MCFTQPQGQLPPERRYSYDPYGELQPRDPESSDDAEDQLAPAARENPFRFQGHYYDSAVKSYDMLARHYRPEAARFLSEDRFQAAGADLELQTDPLTQNRYAFAGGNPVTRIEFDGHDPCYGPYQRAGCRGGLVRDRKGNVVGTKRAENCGCPVKATYSNPAARRAADAGLISPISGTPLSEPQQLHVRIAYHPNVMRQSDFLRREARLSADRKLEAGDVEGLRHQLEAAEAFGERECGISCDVFRVVVGEGPIEIGANFFPFVKAANYARRGLGAAARGLGITGRGTEKAAAKGRKGQSRRRKGRRRRCEANGWRPDSAAGRRAQCRAARPE